MSYGQVYTSITTVLNNMKIYFSHGMESGPWGSKIKHLAAIAKEAGHTVESIDYRETKDPDVRVSMLLKALENDKEPPILVGSSMGGYVSLVASQQVKVQSLFLLAPALYMDGYKVQMYPSKTTHIEVVHGWSDDIIPVGNSVQFARQANCTLHLLKGDHRLNSSIEEVMSLFSRFLTRAH
jgi:predicted esterase